MMVSRSVAFFLRFSTAVVMMVRTGRDPSPSTEKMNLVGSGLTRMDDSARLTVLGHGPERDRLLLMAGKLWRFMQPLMLLALGFGLWLWLGFGVGTGTGWMHAKLAIVLLLLGYHHLCGRLLKRLRNGDQRSYVYFREEEVHPANDLSDGSVPF